MRLVLARLALGASLLAACSATYSGPPEDPADATPDEDASTTEAGADGATGSDAAATVCAPRTDADFTPTWKPPRTPRDLCTADQVHDGWQACFSSSAASFTCGDFRKANEPCAECMVTTYQHATYGPIVVLENGTYEANIGGCLALADGDTSATGCGAKYQALTACEDTACGACDLTSHEAFERYLACLDRAEETLCKPYREAATCAGSSTYDTCFAKSFDEYVIRLATLFCTAHAPTLDAGTDDAGTDDAGDAGDASDADPDANDAAGD